MSKAARTAIAIAAVSLFAGSGVATAQGLGNSRAYMKIFAGATVPQDDTFSLDESGEDPLSSGLDYDAGTIFGIAAGYNVTPNAALEFEYAYRVADATLDAGSEVDGQTKASSYMANAVYTFNPVDAAGAVKPYAGIGLGATDLTYEPGSGLERLGGDLSFSYQAIAGIGYQVNESWTLSGEVRYFGVTEDDLSNSFAGFKTTYQTLDALVGATYRF